MKTLNSIPIGKSKGRRIINRFIITLILFISLSALTVKSQTITLPGSTIGTLSYLNISYSNASGISGSWIGLYPVDANDLGYLTYQYIDTSVNGNLMFKEIEQTGLFNFRMFRGNGYDKICTSPTFLIKQGAIHDSAFQNGGIYRSDVLLNNLDNWGTVVKITNNDKIVVAGTAKTGILDPDNFEMNEFTVTRFNADGTLDNSFGQNGIVHTSFNTISAKELKAMAVQSDGKIIVGGNGVIQGSNRMYAFMMMRYTINGQPDNSFGTNGLVITNMRYSNEPANYCDDDMRCIEVQYDGKILVSGGSIVNLPFFPGRPVIARYNSDGSPDNLFGTEGKVTPDLYITYRGYAESIIPPTQSGDGSFYIGVTASAQSGMNGNVIYKLHENGNFVTGFGTGGAVLEMRPGYHNNQYVKSLAKAPDGSLILMGGSNTFAFWTMKKDASDGSSISSFGDNGLVYYDPTYSGDTPCGMVFGNDDNIVIGTTTLNNRWSIAKLSLTGQIMTEFGTSFFELKENNNTVQSFVSSIAKQSDGKYILTGGSKFPSSGNWDLIVMRFKENPEVYIGINQISSVVPEKFELRQNYPNPFNPVTNLEFGISELGLVSLKVYDVMGREVVTLINEIKEPGYYRVKFNAANLSSGVYYYKMTAGDFVAVKKLVVLK
ncbi:MAG: T9SS type A sorting domain-containing protein [Ignavibacteriae bacterium]|nr:T9SS type A sorting domain-containing protein [Ignavibacteriota bacterium]